MSIEIRPDANNKAVLSVDGREVAQVIFSAPEVEERMFGFYYLHNDFECEECQWTRHEVAEKDDEISELEDDVAVLERVNAKLNERLK